MPCAHCSPDEFVADRSTAMDHAIKTAKRIKDELGIEIDSEFVITIACFLTGVGLGGD